MFDIRTSKNRGLSRGPLSRQMNEPEGGAAGLSGVGLGKPTIKFEFENNDELKKFLQENENLIDSEAEEAEIVEDAPDYDRRQLKGYGDKYEFTDLRKRGKKEPGDVKTLSTKNLVISLKEKAPRNFNPRITENTPGYGIMYFKYIDNKSPIEIEITYKNSKGRYGSYWASVKVDFSRLYNWRKHPYDVKNYDALIADDYYLALVDGWCNEYIEKLVDDSTYDKYYDEDRKKEIAKLFIDSGILDKWATPETKKRALDLYKKRFYKRYNQDLNGLEGPRNPDKYNYKLSDLDCKGMKPTYRKLKDYSHLINEKSVNTDTYVGEGFDNTEKELCRTVIECYKSVKPLAEHLKADDEKQSAFNVWYWLQENIRYNYDSEGKEEVRSPARSWRDRKRGVDCDCLAVFTYCLLLNMGYYPKFEIVSFAGKDVWAHIYVNLNGLAIDRVLDKFGQRPGLISKTKMLEVPVYSLRGPDSSFMAGLAGLEATVLRKMAHGVATQEDCCNWRKVQAVKRMADSPVEQKVLTYFMPYIYDVDLTDGSLYFLPAYDKIAKISQWADSKLMQLAAKYNNCGLSGSREYVEELNGIIKKIGKAVKKAATSVAKAATNTVKAAAKATATVAKATATAVKTAATTTAKVTTAAVKSTANAVKATANVVKAGVQAATGNTTAAKETLNKAGQQAKAAVTQPVKAAVQATATVAKSVATTTKDVVKNAVVAPTVTAVKSAVDVTKNAVVQPAVTAVKVAVDLVKVLLVKINPVTVLMRNALRALIGINFLGLASRLAVGKMTKDEANKTYGIDATSWDNAKKGYDRTKKFFTKMGGDGAKLDKTIENAKFKKALFKKDYKLTQTITDNDELKGLEGLGEPVTIGSCLAAVGAFFAKIWGWLKNVVTKLAGWMQKNDTIVKAATSLVTKKDNTTPATPDNGNANNGDDGTKKKKVWPWVLAAAGCLYLATRSKKKGSKKK